METVTKLDAARRHLDLAIRLFFEERDALGVHTLAAAAQGILRDLARANGGERRSILHDHPQIPADRRKDWIAVLNAPRNFFKHADNDPGGSLEFDEEENVLVLLDAVLLYGELAPEYLSAANVFMGWFTTRNPEMRGAITGNQIGDYAVRNSYSPNDRRSFGDLIDQKLLIERFPAEPEGQN